MELPVILPAGPDQPRAKREQCLAHCRWGSQRDEQSVHTLLSNRSSLPITAFA